MEDGRCGTEMGGTKEDEGSTSSDGVVDGVEDRELARSLAEGELARLFIESYDVTGHSFDAKLSVVLFFMNIVF